MALPVDPQRPFGNPVNTAKHLEQSRFTRAVLAHQGMDLPGMSGEAHLIQRTHAGEDDANRIET